MIHIATVHWLDETWVDIQLSFFRRFLSQYPYRIYAFLNGIDPEPYRHKIHYLRTDPIAAHIRKLNILADHIGSVAAQEDILLFIDGDAFPIGNIGEFLTEQLSKFPLVAIQRSENCGDPQPHPSFCATTVQFWKRIQGDWGQGPQWETFDGRKRTDTGALLWDKLTKKKIPWKKMLRSNRVDLHPLWFGVYANLVYHHGAAFRIPYCSVDIEEAKKTRWKRWCMRIADSRLGSLGGGWVQNAVYSYTMRNRIQKSLEDSRRISKEILQDPYFAKRFCPSLYSET